MMSLQESSLLTTEPYHIPGYRGYCPQFKYKIKETFGKMTHDLLTSKEISRSGRPVLANLGSAQKNPSLPLDGDLLLTERRCISSGDQKYGGQMVPGYTGYIPKGQHHFGDRYAVFCINAIAHMEADKDKLARQKTSLKDMNSRRVNKDSGLETAKVETCLATPSPNAALYFPRGIQHSLSPYVMYNDNPGKYMMSGYTGFVPWSRDLIGMGYPTVTNQALQKFSDHFQKKKQKGVSPIVLNKPRKQVVETQPIYREDSGMVPHYTGHVPGEKFRYGRTFGHSTTNVIQQTGKREK